MPGSRAADRLIDRRLDGLLGALILLVSFSVFLRAPIQQAGDSRYTMLLAENILRTGDFTLDRYNLPDPDYHLQDVEGHRYYYFRLAHPFFPFPSWL
jgi:hypothetical protein